MGRLFLVELALVPTQITHHYRCRRCYPAQIDNRPIFYVALKRDRVHERFVNSGKYYFYTYNLDRQTVLAGNYRPMYFYTKAVNVTFGEPLAQPFYGKVRGVMADMYCNQCNMHLGWKFIESFKPKYNILEGLYVFDRTKLHLWADRERDAGSYIGSESVCL